MFSACGQLIVASEQERSKVDWSDALFLQVLEGRSEETVGDTSHINLTTMLP